MKIKIPTILLMIFIIFMITSCNKYNIKSKEPVNNYNEVMDSVKIFIDEKEYTINLENNETVKNFIDMLPLTLKMNELNGNEKYVYLDENLPNNPINPGRINAGDVMLYGDNCLVIFYKSFDTSYRYTKIGHIDSLEDLGSKNINVKIDK